MGLRHAKEFLFTGERITAEQAYRVGMVNRVVAREALDDATLAIAERIAQAPPFAMRALKNRSTAPMTSKGSAMRCKRISILIRSLTRRRSSLKSGISACRRSSRTTRPIRGRPVHKPVHSLAPHDAAASAMRRLLDPRSIAIIGASADRKRLGGVALDHLVDFGYGGRSIRSIRSIRRYMGCAAIRTSIPCPRLLMWRFSLSASTWCCRLASLPCERGAGGDRLCVRLRRSGRTRGGEAARA